MPQLNRSLFNKALAAIKEPVEGKTCKAIVYRVRGQIVAAQAEDEGFRWVSEQWRNQGGEGGMSRMTDVVSACEAHKNFRSSGPTCLVCLNDEKVELCMRITETEHWYESQLATLRARIAELEGALEKSGMGVCMVCGGVDTDCGMAHGKCRGPSFGEEE